MSATNPTSRQEFRNYILAKLGAPILQINVTDHQIDMAIEESLQWYWDYHFSGSEHVYLARQIDQTDVNNRYVSIPSDILGVNEVYSIASSAINFDAGALTGGWNMLMDLVWSTSGGSLQSYYIAKMNYEMINQILIGQMPIRFNEHNNRIYIDTTWSRWNVGDIIVFDAYQKIDPDEHPSVWNDRFLKDYATQKVKLQWGENLSKFAGVQLTGGIQFDGVRIKEEARDEIIQIEEMLRNYSVPPRDYVG